MDGASQFLCVASLRGSAVGPLFTCVPSVGKSGGGSAVLCLMELMVEGKRETSNKKT